MLPASLKFSKTSRLNIPPDFQAVFAQPQPLRSRSVYFTILARPNPEKPARLGIIVAKRIIRRAVRRNAARRLIRESFRMNQGQLLGLDIVVLVKSILPQQENRVFYNCLKTQWQELIGQWHKE